VKKSEQLEPLANIAGVQTREAARRLAMRLDDVRNKETEVERLRSYLEEYRQMSHDSARSVSSSRWQNEQRFLARLSEAVTLQEAELASAMRRFNEEAERWRKSHRHSKALEQLSEKYRKSELLGRERREQEEMDELIAARVQRGDDPLA
jgi:flagellar export protein FliJ